MVSSNIFMIKYWENCYDFVTYTKKERDIVLHVITVMDSISTASMPLNEFVIYRAKHGYKMHQSLIVTTVCEKDASVEIPDSVNIYYVGLSIYRIYKVLKSIKEESRRNNDTVVFHLHQPKSALIFYMAMIFLHYWRNTIFTVHSTFEGRDIKYKLSSLCCAICSRYIVFVSKTSFYSYPVLMKILKQGRLLYIVNGVDSERIDSRCNRGLFLDGKNTLVYVARFIKSKNHVFLIKLLKKLPKQKLLFIGDGLYKDNVRRLAEQEGVSERIIFSGMLPRECVFDILKVCRVYLSPSLLEGMPVSVLEAMVSRCIPIVSDINPHREIYDKCNDVIVLPLDVELWRLHIKKILDLDEHEYVEKSNNIRNCAIREFSLQKMNNRYCEIYRRVSEVL